MTGSSNPFPSDFVWGAVTAAYSWRLRHFFASEFLSETGDLALTQYALGHVSPTTTRIYAQTKREDYRQAHQHVFGSKRGRQRENWAGSPLTDIAFRKSWHQALSLCCFLL